MRFLVLHVDYFRSEITERGRAPLTEPYSDPVTELTDGLVVLTSVEKGDETSPAAVAEKAAAELAEIAQQVGATRLLLHSFAHLFGELARPAEAVFVLDITLRHLKAAGLDARRTPFGWFNTLEIRAKGHPLSRIARIVEP